jgi:hypothetical protein
MLKAMLRFGALVGILTLGLLAASCGSETVAPPPPVGTTGISGTVTLLPGVNGDPINARVAIYSSLADFMNDAPLKEVSLLGSIPNFYFLIIGINAGNVYVDIWKDLNNDGQVTIGDVYGWYGSRTSGAPNPIIVLDKQMTVIAIQLWNWSTLDPKLPRHWGGSH